MTEPQTTKHQLEAAFKYAQLIKQSMAALSKLSEEADAQFIALTEAVTGGRITAELLDKIQAWHLNAPATPTLEGTPWTPYAAALHTTLEETS